MQIERTLDEPLDSRRSSAARMLAAASRIRAVTSSNLRPDAHAAHDRTSPVAGSAPAPAVPIRGRRVRPVSTVQRAYREPVVPVLDGDWCMAWE